MAGVRVFGNDAARRAAGFGEEAPHPHPPASRPIPPPVSRPIPPAGPSVETQLRQELAQVRAERDAIGQELQKVRHAEGPYGVVLRVDGTKALCVVGGRQYQTVALHDHTDVEVGDAVRFAKTEKGLALAEIAKQVLESCPIVTVTKLLPKKRFECLLNGGPRVVRLGKVTHAEPGDRLTVDPDGQIALENLGSEKPLTISPETVEWSDVGGLEEAKKKLKEVIEDPVRHKNLYKAFKLKAPRGVLLYGPPGGGKTLLVRACATALARMHGASAQSTGFLPISGPQAVLNKFVGQSEENIKRVFDAARQHHKQHGYPAIVFVDEADALLGKRGMRPWDGMERTIVPTFLAEMDGIDTHEFAPLVILATNRPDILDDAIVRPGRIDLQLEIGWHEGAAAQRIVEIHLKDRPIEAGLVDAILAKTKMPASGAVLENAVTQVISAALQRAKDGGEHRLLLKDVF